MDHNVYEFNSIINMTGVLQSSFFSSSHCLALHHLSLRKTPRTSGLPDARVNNEGVWKSSDKVLCNCVFIVGCLLLGILNQKLNWCDYKSSCDIEMISYQLIAGDFICEYFNFVLYANNYLSAKTCVDCRSALLHDTFLNNSSSEKLASLLNRTVNKHYSKLKESVRTSCENETKDSMVVGIVSYKQNKLRTSLLRNYATSNLSVNVNIPRFRRGNSADTNGSTEFIISYCCALLVGFHILRLLLKSIRMPTRSQCMKSCQFSKLFQLLIFIAVPVTLGTPLDGGRTISNGVSISSSVVGGVNTTENGRVCWNDADCSLYPFCRIRPSSCRCIATGRCVTLRGYKQKCTSSSLCEDTMYCQKTDGGGSRAVGVCRCETSTRYYPHLRQCLRPAAKEDDMSRFSELDGEDVNVSENDPVKYFSGRDMPRFADLPDPGEEDADVPEEIPATYGGAILVGFLSLGLVIVCLSLAMWCHYTSSRLRAQQLLHPLPQSHEYLYSAPKTLHRPEGFTTGIPPDERDVEKIPLDMFIPPPEMYRTPGFHNYLTINDGVTNTSQAQESLGMLGAELSRTLR